MKVLNFFCLLVFLLTLGLANHGLTESHLEYTPKYWPSDLNYLVGPPLEHWRIEPPALIDLPTQSQYPVESNRAGSQAALQIQHEFETERRREVDGRNQLVNQVKQIYQRGRPNSQIQNFVYFNLAGERLLLAKAALSSRLVTGTTGLELVKAFTMLNRFANEEISTDTDDLGYFASHVAWPVRGVILTLQDFLQEAQAALNKARELKRPLVLDIDMSALTLRRSPIIGHWISSWITGVAPRQVTPEKGAILKLESERHQQALHYDLKILQSWVDQLHSMLLTPQQFPEYLNVISGRDMSALESRSQGFRCYLILESGSSN